MKSFGQVIRLLAAFGAGVTLWEAVVHGSLLANRQSPQVFGVKLVPGVNLVQTIVPAIASVALARLAFAPGRSKKAKPQPMLAAI